MHTLEYANFTQSNPQEAPLLSDGHFAMDTATIVLETNVRTKFDAIVCACLCSNSNRFFIVSENNTAIENALSGTRLQPQVPYNDRYMQAQKSIGVVAIYYPFLPLSRVERKISPSESSPIFDRDCSIFKTVCVTA